MSHANGIWGDRGHCPHCGRFCAKITGTISQELGLRNVTGICKVHGLVDLSNQEWSFSDFYKEVAHDVR